MKKIEFYTTERKDVNAGRTYEKNTGYYYKTANGLEFAIHKSNYFSVDFSWKATEIKTGCTACRSARTIQQVKEDLDRRADCIKRVIDTDPQKYLHEIINERKAQGII